MNIKREYVVREEERNTRIDKLLATLLPSRSRSRWQKLINQGHVTIEDSRIKPSYKVTPGERIDIEVPESFNSRELVPQQLPLEIVYEDSSIIGINKPDSLVVHPGPGHQKGTLANGLIYRYPDLPGLPDPTRPGIVHRLDKNTSGILVIARTNEAFRDLKGQFKDREVEKEYLALVSGRLKENRGLIDAPVGRSSKDKTKMTVKLGGKEAQTRFRVINRLSDFTLLKVMPLTGRTHQIRVHMDYIGHRILGDRYYGGPPHNRLMLHSKRLKVKHPETGKIISLEAPTPQEFENYL
ncbi:MAG: RluA family pseudouridine synthase [Candidatus Bipolaricaulota bacterium]